MFRLFARDDFNRCFFPFPRVCPNPARRSEDSTMQSSALAKIYPALPTKSDPPRRRLAQHLARAKRCAKFPVRGDLNRNLFNFLTRTPSAWMMLRLYPTVRTQRQIVFSLWVTLSEHKWVIPVRPEEGILTPGFGYSITAVPKFPDRPGMENRVHFSYASEE